MTKAVKAPLRGDVVILDFNPQAGHEQAELQGNQAHLISQWEVIHGTNR